ncbi:MAG TPA: cell division protein ZapA [Candidatus Binatia bacterium]|jgi:cell division protein ZapA
MSEPLEIEIMGQRLTVRSEDSEEHVRAVARYVDEQIRLLADTQLATTSLHLALVTALNIASEYWKLQHQQEEVYKTMNRMTQRIGARLHR